ncbi:cytochrome P450 [Trametes elegans]|nr:cytochrome P450 [Trametes elegans]
MSMQLLAYAGIVISLLVIAQVTVVNGRVTPPGPRAGPSLRNALKRRPYDVFSRWSEQYNNSVVSFKMLWKRVVVVNRFDAGDALFNKRCAAFSDRPFRVVANLCEYDRSLVFMSQGPRFRRTRRLYHDVLNARTIASQLPYFESLTPKFLASLLDAPTDVHRHIHFFFTGTILAWTLGYHARDEHDDLLVLSEKVSDNAIHMTTPGVRIWVELFPLFKYLPLWMAGRAAAATMRGFKDDLKLLLRRSEAYARACLEKGSRPSFLSNILKDATTEEERDIALYSSVSLTGGAYDTMISVTESFFVAMIRYPESQRKAQEEIDRVVGRNRLPTAADRCSLPYTEALLTEVMRWVPPVPFTSRAIPKDEEYEGMVFPKNSSVVANIWGMTHDPARFPDPDVFRPERYLPPLSPSGDSGNGPAPEPAAAAREVRKLVFGFGRRICPGQFYADALLWIALVRVLATMAIAAPPGQPAPEPELVDGAIIRFAPFPCEVRERFKGARALVGLAERQAEDRLT